MIARRIRYTGLAMLALLATACCAAAAFASPPSASFTGARPAKPSTKPAWPDSGIAQQTTGRGTGPMFMENDDGHWHAWVLYGYGSNKDPSKVMALDFFTSKTMPVKEDLIGERQDPIPAFTDAQGHYHGAPSQKFESNQGLPETLETASWNDVAKGYTDHESPIPCSAFFSPIIGGLAHHGAKPKWSKIVVYRSAPNSVCKHGDYMSDLGPSLDLGDGTFLTLSGCHVVRLRISNLEPVGKAPSIRIVDASVMRKAMRVVRERRMKDPTLYLDQILHLNINNASSCN